VISPQEAAFASALESRLSPEADGKPDAEGALAMLALLARAGHEDDSAAGAAWLKGVATLKSGGFPLPSPPPGFASIDPRARLESASHASRLAAMDEDLRRVLLAAMADVAAHDGRLRPGELQLLRAAAAALGSPMPPIEGVRASGEGPL
jgi:hypothetical protein